MKLSALRILEIVLCLIMIAAVFMPFAHSWTPFEFAFGWVSNWFGIIAVTIPLTLLILLLLLLVFKGKLKGSLLKILLLVALLLFLLVFGIYVYEFVRDQFEGVAYHYALILSLVLSLVSLKFGREKSDVVVNIVLAVITLPFVFHMNFIAFDYDVINYGGWIIEGAFILLYIIRFVSVFKR